MATVQDCENIHGMQLTNMELESHMFILINIAAP